MKKQEMVFEIVNMTLGLVATSMAVFIVWFYSNSDGWSKLREFHLDKYLNNLENPYFFLFSIKWKYRNLYNSHRMAKYYYKYLKERTAGLDPQIMGVLEYPSWRKNAYHK
jgi:hypothetical protein